MQITVKNLRNCFVTAYYVNWFVHAHEKKARRSIFLEILPQISCRVQYRQRKRATTSTSIALRRNFQANLQYRYLSFKLLLLLLMKRPALHVTWRFFVRLVCRHSLCLTFPNKVQPSELRAACMWYFTALFHLYGSSEGLILLKNARGSIDFYYGKTRTWSIL